MIKFGKFTFLLSNGLFIQTSTVQAFINKHKTVLITLGCFILFFGVFRILHLNQTPASFSSEDVVYGQKIQTARTGRMNTMALTKKLPVSQKSVQPKLQVSEPFFDFGEIEGGQLALKSFVIANNGQAALVIQNPYTTCGCTTAEFSASEIPPGKAVLMKLFFDPDFHAMHGTTVRRGVIFETNDPDHPIQEIWVQATVK
jgi:hypothetical protein